MTAPNITRKQAWCMLAVLIADGLPTPDTITFIDPSEPDHEWSSWTVDVVLDDAGALFRWADHFGIEPGDPHKPGGGEYWHQRAETRDWHGYFLTLKTYRANSLGADTGLGAVRAIAAEVSS